MLTKDSAYQRVEAELRKLQPPDQSDAYAIDAEQTIEFSWGWVFFWNSRQFLETGDDSHVLFGNAPFIVDKNTGVVHITGTERSIEDYVGEFERQAGY